MSINVSSPTNNIPTRPTTPVRFGKDDGKHAAYGNKITNSVQVVLSSVSYNDLLNESGAVLTDESGANLTIE